MAVSAAFSRDILWRVPGQTAMSGEYRGRRDVVEFLRRTGLETGGTYNSHLHTVFADDAWAVAIYRATGSRNGIELDVEQALVIRIADGLWQYVTAVPLDSAFERFWA
jgi:ketosteroid isomerase-like protein